MLIQTRTIPLLFSALLAGICLQPRCAEAQSSLHMHWELPETVYIVGEEIQPVGFLRNYSDTAAAYSRKDFQEYSLLNFTTVKPEKRHFGQMCFGSPKQLQPGDSSDYTTPSLLMYYGRGSYIGRFYLLPGSYAFFSPELSSDTVFFVVEEPASEIDIEAWESLRRALDSSYTVLSSLQDEYDYYSMFVKKYPESIYTPRVLSFLVAVLPENSVNFPERERSSYANELLLNYPTSPHAMWILYRVDPSLLSEDEISLLESSLTKITRMKIPAGFKRQAIMLLNNKTPLLEQEGKR